MRAPIEEPPNRDIEDCRECTSHIARSPSRNSTRKVGGRGHHPQGVRTQNKDGTEQNPTPTGMVLKAKDNDRRKNIALSSDEFHGS
ncbi:hypothetical protein TNCV_1647421 [Trichonephila clavipes]|nr:hypothetical protein TNCV_1647421 [Trichonephila clavipes]